MDRIESNGWMVKAASSLFLLAGIIHLIIIPNQWQHAPAHGIAMGIIGIVQIAWGILFWLKPTNRMATLGLVIAVSCIVLWAITRVLPAPFTNGPEEVDANGVISKAIEIMGAILLIRLLWTRPEEKFGSYLWRTIVPVIVLSVVFVLGVYEVALASQPLFPFLAAPENQQQDGHSHQQSQVIEGLEPKSELEVLRSIVKSFG